MTTETPEEPLFIHPRRKPRNSTGMPTLSLFGRALATAFLLASPLLAPVALADTPPLVERALENMKKTELDEYAYTMTTVRSAKQTVARHDPAKPGLQRWDLLSKDGKPPTAKEQKEFREERAEREEDRDKARQGGKTKGGGNGERELSAMIAPGSLQLISETPERASYRFKMNAEDEKDRAFTDSVRGTLVIQKSTPHVKSLDLASTGEIKPATGVKLTEFRMTMTFHPPASGGEALPATIHTVVKGRALLVKKIDEDVTVTFSDFARRRTASAVPAPAR